MPKEPAKTPSRHSIVRSGSGAELLADPIVRDAYLGVLQE